jgi:chloramphenicol O-acetyltransferase
VFVIFRVRFQPTARQGELAQTNGSVPLPFEFQMAHRGLTGVSVCDYYLS